MTKIQLLFSLAALLSSACSTTNLVDHWQAENFSRNDLNNILIVAVTSNETNRFLFEGVIERAMLDAGLSGSASFRVLGDTLPTKEDVEAYVVANDVDYVIATKLANVEVEKDFIPPSVRTYYTGPYYASYGHYYDYGNTITLIRDARVETRTTYVLVTTIFDARTSEPVWVGRSKTFEPSSVAHLAADIAKSTWDHISR